MQSLLPERDRKHRASFPVQVDVAAHSSDWTAREVNTQPAQGVRKWEGDDTYWG